MNKTINVVVTIFLILSLSNIVSASIVSENMNKNVLSGILSTSDFNSVKVVKTQVLNNSVLWIQLKLSDSEPLPITVDILFDIFKNQNRTIYMSPGSGLNVESDFITPKSNNLALFLASKGYLVFGITPREDNAPDNFNVSLMKDWGLAFHTNDFKKIIDLVQSVDNKDYEVLGHSAGALNVLNYASIVGNNTKLKNVRIIDIVGQYQPGSIEFNNSKISLDAENTILSQGIFVNTDNIGFKFIAQQESLNPTGDSGFPRGDGLVGNFTNEGLFFFALINTNLIPGVLTPITGLPSLWNLKQGFLAGTYEFNITDPSEDVFSLSHANVSTINSAINALNSGIYPNAYDRDFFALWSGTYPLDWSNIRVPVTWINTELGFGNVSHSISLLTNSNVTSAVVRNYGHADPVYSRTAKDDFWNVLFP